MRQTGSISGLGKSQGVASLAKGRIASSEAMCRRHRRRAFGFTLLELMIVISIILIVMSIALPVYTTSILRSKESVLKQDLFTLREVIDQYTYDKQKAPQSLDDLVTANYLKKLPVDPMTGQADWVPETEDVLTAIDQQEPGINGVHSASAATGSDGKAYSEW